MEFLAVGGRQAVLEPSPGSLLMKIDIEGAEWPTLGTASTETLRKFRQLLIECPGTNVWFGGYASFKTYPARVSGTFAG